MRQVDQSKLGFIYLINLVIERLFIQLLLFHILRFLLKPPMNLLSLKMELADDTLQRLNDVLPKQIKVFGYNKVTQGFDCKQNCDARTYIYILPTYAFCPIEEVINQL